MNGFLLAGSRPMHSAVLRRVAACSGILMAAALLAAAASCTNDRSITGPEATPLPSGPTPTVPRCRTQSNSATSVRRP